VKALRALARVLASDALADLPADRFDRVKRHIVDTLGARLTASQTDEGAAAGRAAAALDDSVTTEVIAGCAQARCTEVDDIHLASCVTPGAIVVPTVLAFASRGAFRSTGDCAAAALAGYEAAIRLGMAIAGPRALLHGTWPTGYAAAFGSGAAAARALALDEAQTAGALATALAMASRTGLPGALPSSSRWMALGVAAANGVAAAQAARAGLFGTCADAPELPARPGRSWLFDDIGTKPYPTARQALAAVEAARDLAREEEIDPNQIDEMLVFLPEPQRRIVDRPGPPATRFESIVSVQYQLALALVEPARLPDVRRTPPFINASVRALLRKITVRRARDLERDYPRAWPARVEIRIRGRRMKRVVRHPHGDARRPFTWDDVAFKFRRLAGPVTGEAEADRIVQAWREATPASPLPPFMARIIRESA
jgi:2-methylcitrate dehydratase PrpD